jgi:FkbM family methyltransferase
VLAGAEFLAELLAAKRMCEIVDVGANPIDGDPPYGEMLRGGFCRVTGFEPQPEALALLQTTRGPLETYLPYVVGDGKPGMLRVASAGGMTSLLEPDRTRLTLFNGFEEWGRVVERIPLATIPLDAVREIEHMDMLKIDVQGAEMMVFASGRERLSETVFVHTEVSFVPLYEGQPTIGEVDCELRGLGFIPHAIAALKRWPISPTVYDGDFRKAMHQVLEADFVYMPDFARWDDLTDEQLKHLGLLAHCVYGSSDLAHRCILTLRQRGLVPENSPEQYLSAAHPPHNRGAIGPRDNLHGA